MSVVLRSLIMLLTVAVLVCMLTPTPESIAEQIIPGNATTDLNIVLSLVSGSSLVIEERSIIKVEYEINP